jgi:hypothetical protein
MIKKYIKIEYFFPGIELVKHFSGASILYKHSNAYNQPFSAHINRLGAPFLAQLAIVSS